MLTPQTTSNQPLELQKFYPITRAKPSRVGKIERSAISEAQGPSGSAVPVSFCLP